MGYRRKLKPALMAALSTIIRFELRAAFGRLFLCAATSGFGTSRHFVATRNLVATGGIADIGQAHTNRVRLNTRP